MSLLTDLNATSIATALDWVRSELPEVSFQWKNPDFLLKNTDFLFRNPGFLLKNVDFIAKTGRAGNAADAVLRRTE